MMHSISVVLPNFNGRNLLERNIPSLLQALGDLENEIIVVDDCSSDDSVQFLKTTYPSIKVIQNKQNFGFSTTCNNGIHAARLELICVVNTDVTFTPDYFSKVINEFDDPAIFAVKGNIINYGKSFEDIINIDRTGQLYYKRGFLRFSSSNPLLERTVINCNDKNFVFLGCCFVCNREMIVTLNGFDAIYSPFYWEDADLAQRGMKRGYKLVYLPDACVYHQASSTISKYRSKIQRQLISNRNKFIFTWHHLDTWKLYASHIPITAFNLFTRWLILDWKYYVALYMAITHKLRWI